MKLDEFAFLNQQLAGMLKSGIPLEGALREVCGNLRPGPMQSELRALEGDLARGTPLRDALAARRLPPFYTQMVRLGAQSNNLPALLTMLADYYQRAGLAWTRLQSLLVYPLIVLAGSLALSVMVAIVYGQLARETVSDMGFMANPGARWPSWTLITTLMWAPACVIGAVLAAVVAGLMLPGWRRRWRWRAPAFKEASLSQLAAGLGLLLENGSSLPEALTFTQQLEAGSPVARELQQWHARLAEGRRKFDEIAAGSTVVPPLFVWVVASAGENLAAGFRSAAQLYFERAVHRTELILYAVLPVAVLALGVMIILQVAPMTQFVVKLIQSLGMFEGE